MANWVASDSVGHALLSCRSRFSGAVSLLLLITPLSLSVAYRNPATMGLCSKCYRESESAMQKKAHETSVQKVAPKAAPSIVELPAPVEEVEIASPAAPVPAEAAPEVSVAAEGEAVPAEPEKPVQANRSRCYGCNKKVGLLGFECRCGYVFCSSHRHAQEHACTFDYAAFDRERLAKANPLVAASKLDKL